jgi:putative transposase
MSRRPIEFQMWREDQRAVLKILRAGIQQVRVVLRAIALGQLTACQSAPAVAGIVHLSPQAVRRIAHRYQKAGLEGALYERQGRCSQELLDNSEKQRVIAMVCSQPPAGQARWTVRMIAEEAVKRNLVLRVGRETIRVSLTSHDLKPWRERNVASPTSTPITCARWKTFWPLYEKPYRAAEPVFCLDEKPVSLHVDLWAPLPARPGRVAKRDNEYKRCGTANVFCAVEPKAGQAFYLPNQGSLGARAGTRPESNHR